jgi:hypothetical protein
VLPCPDLRGAAVDAPVMRRRLGGSPDSGGGVASIGDGGGVGEAGMVLRGIQVPSSPLPSVVARRRAGAVAAVVAGGAAGFDSRGRSLGARAILVP